jgi:hypothetical protein
MVARYIGRYRTIICVLHVIDDSAYLRVKCHYHEPVETTGSRLVCRSGRLVGDIYPPPDADGITHRGMGQLVGRLPWTQDIRAGSIPALPTSAQSPARMGRSVLPQPRVADR